MPLTNAAILNAKPKAKPYKLTDGDGMFLFVHPNGSKYWRLKYRYANKEKILALGVYPEVNLAEARERRMQARKMLAAGRDPGEVKKEAKRLLLAKHENTFEVVAREWHQNCQAKWTPLYAKKTLKRLEMHVFPRLGSRPIADITPHELLTAIRKVEERGPDIAHRTLQICGQVFSYAVISCTFP